jgi:hypothetical protein
MPRQSSPQAEKRAEATVTVAASEALDFNPKIPMVGRQAEIGRLVGFLRAKKVRHLS